REEDPLSRAVGAQAAARAGAIFARGARPGLRAIALLLDHVIAAIVPDPGSLDGGPAPHRRSVVGVMPCTCRGERRLHLEAPEPWGDRIADHTNRTPRPRAP